MAQSQISHSKMLAVKAVLVPEFSFD